MGTLARLNLIFDSTLGAGGVAKTDKAAPKAVKHTNSVAHKPCTMEAMQKTFINVYQPIGKTSQFCQDPASALAEISFNFDSLHPPTRQPPGKL